MNNNLFDCCELLKIDRIVIFSPHPDDVSIAMGGLVILALQKKIIVNTILISDGSEAAIPDMYISKHVSAFQMKSYSGRQIRGMIRVGEAREEARRLGMSGSSVRLLKKQAWAAGHHTPVDALNDDGSLRDVSRFKAGPVKFESIDEIHCLLKDTKGKNILCAVPSPFDEQLMHNVSTAIVVKAISLFSQDDSIKRFNLLIYKCLSTMKWQNSKSNFAIGFGEEIMNQKCYAINANQSMKARREMIGGYANKGKLFYDTLIRQKNAADAKKYKIDQPYAECFRLCNVEKKDDWHHINQWADEELSAHQK